MSRLRSSHSSRSVVSLASWRLRRAWRLRATDCLLESPLLEEPSPSASRSAAAPSCWYRRSASAVRVWYAAPAFASAGAPEMPPGGKGGGAGGGRPAGGCGERG